jgi:hypothetical protein
MMIDETVLYTIEFHIVFLNAVMSGCITYDVIKNNGIRIHRVDGMNSMVLIAVG